MRFPNFCEEKKLWKKGYEYVVGLDEVGRGPLAGPVVACAVMVRNPKSQISKRVSGFGNWNLFGYWLLGFGVLKLRDSKKLSPKAREKFYKILTEHPQIKWGIGIVSEKIIDKINIFEATKLAMTKAVNNLKRKVDFLILDGNFKITLPISQKPIIKADEKVFSVASASIIAKVFRDRLMEKYDKKFPNYGFIKHKGYPTKEHFEKLRKYKPCPIHRRSFGPVARCG